MCAPDTDLLCVRFVCENEDKMGKKLQKLNLRGKIKYGYTLVINFMMLSGIISIICLIVLAMRFNNYAKGVQKADSAVKLQVHLTLSALQVSAYIMSGIGGWIL